MPKGWIKGRPRGKGSSWNTGLRIPITVKLERHSQVEPNTGCILWTGALNWAGYGVLNFSGHQKRAHRLAWELENGPVPQGLELDHLCRVRSCINPLHLEAVTSGENSRRGDNFQRNKIHCKNGHELSGTNLLRRYDGFRACRNCHYNSSEASRKRRWGY